MTRVLDLAKNRLPKNELSRSLEGNELYFRTIVNGKILLPANFSMDDGFLGLAFTKKRNSSINRTKSGSAIPDKPKPLTITLEQASREMHERKRKLVELHPPTISKSSSEELWNVQEKEADAESCDAKGETLLDVLMRPPEPKCLGFLRKLKPRRFRWYYGRSTSSTMLLINQMSQSPLPTIDETQPMGDGKDGEEKSWKLSRAFLCCVPKRASAGAT